MAIDIDIRFKDMFSGAFGKALEQMEKMKQATGGAQEKIDKLAFSFFKFNQISEAIRGVNQALESITGPGASFQSALAEVEAITGVTGKALQELGDRARKTNKEFGGNVADKLDAYKVILSRLGPDIAKSPEALDQMGRSVAILSKTMGGDAVASVDALTTGLLQFQVNLDDPIAAAMEMNRQMNIMAAGAKFGSAEIPAISEALKVSGVAASTAKVSFAETNAALQELARGGKEGAEAGTGLRNVINKLSEGRFMPKDTQASLIAAGVNIRRLSDITLPFTNRLRELQKVQGDMALITKLFGLENSAAANILIRSVDAQDELRSKIEGTNTAVEQAKTIMATFKERMGRIKAIMDNMAISIFNATQNFLPLIIMAGSTVQTLAFLAPALQTVTLMGRGMIGFITKSIPAFITFIRTIKLMTIAQRALNIVMKANIFIAIATAIGLVITGLVIAYNKSQTFRAAIAGLIEVGKTLANIYLGIGKTLIGVFTLNPTLISEGARQFQESINKIREKGIGGIFKEGQQKLIEKEGAKAAAEATKKANELVQKRNEILASKGLNPDGTRMLPSADNTIKPPGGNKNLGSEISSVTSGSGGAARNVNVNIQKLVEKIEIHTTSIKEGAKDIEKQIMEVLVKAVRNSEIALSSD